MNYLQNSYAMSGEHPALINIGEVFVSENRGNLVSVTK